MIIYNPADWYWVVSNSTTEVWSSARVGYFPINDTTYVNWLSDVRKPTYIANAGELYDVLLAQWLPTAQEAGVSVSSTANSALNGTYAIDASAQANLAALSTGIAAGKPLPGGGATMNYPDSSRTMHEFASADFLNFAAAIEEYLYESAQVLLDRLNGADTAMPSAALTIP